MGWKKEGGYRLGRVSAGKAGIDWEGGYRLGGRVSTGRRRAGISAGRWCPRVWSTLSFPFVSSRFLCCAFASLFCVASSRFLCPLSPSALSLSAASAALSLFLCCEFALALSAFFLHAFFVRCLPPRVLCPLQCSSVKVEVARSSVKVEVESSVKVEVARSCSLVHYYGSAIFVQVISLLNRPPLCFLASLMHCSCGVDVARVCS